MAPKQISFSPRTCEQLLSVPSVHSQIERNLNPSKTSSSFSIHLFSSGKILSEEEKAAENVYIKKVEQEKLEKLARKGQKAEGSSASTGDSGPGAGSESGSTASSSSAGGVSTDKNRNYAVVAGVLTGLGALGWYLKSKDKKTDDLHD